MLNARGTYRIAEKKETQHQAFRPPRISRVLLLEQFGGADHLACPPSFSIEVTEAEFNAAVVGGEVAVSLASRP